MASEQVSIPGSKRAVGTGQQCFLPCAEFAHNAASRHAGGPGAPAILLRVGQLIAVETRPWWWSCMVIVDRQTSPAGLPAMPPMLPRSRPLTSYKPSLPRSLRQDVLVGSDLFPGFIKRYAVTRSSSEYRRSSRRQPLRSRSVTLQATPEACAVACLGTPARSSELIAFPRSYRAGLSDRGTLPVGLRLG